MRVLLIDNNTRKQFADLIERAENNINTIERIQAIKEGTVNPIGDENYVCIPGYRIAFSFDEHPTMGLVKHLSVSCETPGKLPSVPEVQMIAEEFGFTGDITTDLGGLYLEEFVPGHHAVNILQVHKQPHDAVQP